MEEMTWIFIMTLAKEVRVGSRMVADRWWIAVCHVSTLASLLPQKCTTEAKTLGFEILKI
jgi:hypothetical protein